MFPEKAGIFELREAFIAKPRKAAVHEQVHRADTREIESSGEHQRN
jgi:hypothetical protein